MSLIHLHFGRIVDARSIEKGKKQVEFEKLHLMLRLFQLLINLNYMISKSASLSNTNTFAPTTTKRDKQHLFLFCIMRCLFESINEPSPSPPL